HSASDLLTGAFSPRFYSAALTQTRHLHSSPTRRSSDLTYLDPGRALDQRAALSCLDFVRVEPAAVGALIGFVSHHPLGEQALERDRKSTRLNSSHVETSYAVSCLKKKTSDGGTVSRTIM